MEKPLRIFYLIIMVLILLSLVTSCKKSDLTTSIDPFTNGSIVRNEIVVVSDMHMGADDDYTECKANRAPLAKLLGQMRESPNVKELVIAGDLIDEWFVPTDVDTYGGKDQTEFVQRLAVTNTMVFDVLNQIIKEGKIKVTYVPGNHDLAITADNVNRILPGVIQAHDIQQGLGTYTPTDFPVLAIEHGHRHLNTVTALKSPDTTHPELGFWEVETPSLREFPQQIRTFEIVRNSDYPISLFATDVDPAVKEGSFAAISRSYAIAAHQIFKMEPIFSHNVELVKQLSTEMQAKIKNYGTSVIR